MSSPSSTRDSDPGYEPSAHQIENSFWDTILSACLVGLLFATFVFFINSGLDIVLVKEHEPLRMTVELSDALSAAIIGALSFKLFRYYQAQRRRLRERLEIIADMNHHVRNALQVITFTTASNADQQELETIRHSVNRIQWALRELLPKL